MARLLGKELILSRVEVDDNGCWIWIGRVDRRGYGRGGSANGAHRYSYISFVGPIPEGFEVDHLCFVTRCVNPAHLEAVTPAENLRRKVAKRTRCKRGHEFTPENTYMSGSRRECRTCCANREKNRVRPPLTESQTEQRRAYKREWARQLPPLLAGDPRHGTLHGYKSYRCRCDRCREAKNKTRSDGEQPGVLPIPVRLEPAPGSLRAAHAAALRAEWEQQEAEAKAYAQQAEEAKR